MPSKHPARGGGRRAPACRECGALAADGAQISARDLCLDCSKRRATEQNEQIAAGAGPHFDEYRRGMVEYARRLISS